MKLRHVSILTSYLLPLTLLAIPGIASAFIPSDPLYSHQWYLDTIGAPAAWDITQGNPASIVAIIDLGVSVNNPDLKEAIWTNSGEVAGNNVDDDGNGFIDDVHGWDFVDGDSDASPKYDVAGSDPRDLHHGTIVAGIIAARGNNGEGIAGIDWGAKIMPLRALHSDGSGDVETVIAAFRYAIAKGATIINLSFIGDERSTDLDDLIAQATARGILVVAAGGNEGRNGKGDLDQYPVYPICSNLDGANVLGVAATSSIDEKATFSSYGKCVDIAAPGERMMSTLFYDPSQIIVKIGGAITATTYSQPYGGYFSGTSFAAPVAVGAASLLRGLLPRATPTDIIGFLQRTADPVRNLDYFTTGKMGAGRVNLGRAVAEAQTQATQTPSTTATRVTSSTSLASLADAVTVRVELRSDRGTMLVGRAVALASSRSTDTLTPASATTDAQGVATFTVRAREEGIAELRASIDGVFIGSARAVFARALTAPIGPGSLLRGTTSTVYIISSEGKRYAFPDVQTYRSWYADLNRVQRVSDVVLSAFPLGGLVTIRPGTFLVKVTTDPKTYAVEPPPSGSGQAGGVLRWVPDEATALALYGDQWTKRVVDVPDAFFTNYRVDAPVSAGAHPTGAILEDIRDGQRYYIVNGQRRRIDSTLAFLKNGFQWRDIIKLPSVAYSDGAPIMDREAGLAQPVG